MTRARVEKDLVIIQTEGSVLVQVLYSRLHEETRYRQTHRWHILVLVSSPFLRLPLHLGA